jgi:hypothetical protein
MTFLPDKMFNVRVGHHLKAGKKRRRNTQRNSFHFEFVVRSLSLSEVDKNRRGSRVLRKERKTEQKTSTSSILRENECKKLKEEVDCIISSR